MIALKEVTKEFDNSGSTFKAVDNVSLDIGNEIFGIIGLSGAGKSTVLRMINRLEEPTAGKVLVRDKDIMSLDKKELGVFRSKVGMIFQHFNLLKSRNVARNIAFPLEIAGYPKDKIDGRVKELLRLVELEDKEFSSISQLSGGQKQRVAIARALANSPDILLCDEATSALDPKTTKVILRLLKDIKEKLGLTIILITHEMEVIKEICDRVAIMEEGRIIEMGEVSRVFKKPRTATAKEFLSDLSNNDLDDFDFSPYKGSKVICLYFDGDAVNEPIICKLVKEYDLDVNIISGSIQQLKSESVGSLIVQMKGDDLDRGIEYLKELGIETEVVYNG